MNEFRIDQELFRSIPADLMLRYGFVPYRRDGKALVIVVSDPTDLPMIDELSVLLGTPVRVMVGARSAIESILKKSESSQRVLDEATEEFQIQLLKDDEAGEDNLTVERLTSDISPIIRLVDSTIFTAIQRRASDIHIETQDDAVLREVPHRRRAAAGDAADRQALPQLDHLAHQGHGGARHRREARAAGRPLQAARAGQDHRLPRLDHAERARRGRGHPYSRQAVDQRAVHRAAPRHPRVSRSRSCSGSASTSASPTAWCWSPGRPAAARRRRCTRRWPRSSRSKTRSSRSKTRSSTSCKGITQIPINEKKGLTFARGLRSILRHDPDKIMVGEIRDPETAQIAIQSALTGHLVFTTVHANNVFDVLGRFLNMGVEPYQFISALNCVMAQRLVRRICDGVQAPGRRSTAELLDRVGDGSGARRTRTRSTKAPAASSAAAPASRAAWRSASCST